MIRVLEQTTIDKIAAGEVVERPSSVVKELLENAMDSGATMITVEIKGGGVDLIRITDNGCGIEKDQVGTAFLRHATSKLREIEDLFSLQTLGFRGEALSSIAAVAHVELLTKTKEAQAGVRYAIEDGKEIAYEETACPDGTTIVVKDLFFHTPARRKFLKSETTETGYITDLIEQFALMRPDIAFRYLVGDKQKLFTSGNGSLKDVIYGIYGKDIVGNLIPIANEAYGLKMEGFVAKPYISRGNRSFEHYFVNDRYIKNPAIMKAIEEAYKTFVMIHKFPFVVLKISVDPGKLDVNVHPQKMEMRYSETDVLYRFIYHTIRDALYQNELTVDIATDSSLQSQKDATGNALGYSSSSNASATTHGSTGANGSPTMQHFQDASSARMRRQMRNERDGEASEQQRFEANRVAESPTYNTAATAPANPSAGNLQHLPNTTTPSTEVVEVPKNLHFEQSDLFGTGFINKDADKEYHLIGQLFSTYWLIEYQDNLLIMDQHAAHEKVNFERFFKAYREHSIDTQICDPAMVLQLQPKQAAKLRENLDLFASMGFVLESFGGNSYLVREVPLTTYGYLAEDLILELVDSLDEETGTVSEDLFIWKIASMSCKAAIKGNQKISFAEAEALVDALMELDNPYNCPHGRPTMLAMTKTEIEKKIKRIQD